MSKKTRKPDKPIKNKAPRRKTLVISGLILSLLLASAAFGKWGGFLAPRKPRPAPTASPAPSGSAPSSPSKEYIYAGGRLVATEEPTGQGCSYSLSPTTVSYITGAAVTDSFAVTAPTGCAWTATTTDTFITINAPSGGSGNGSVSFSLSANPGAARNGTIKVQDQTFSISQAAGSGCTSSLSPTGAPSVAATGGSGSFTVTTQPGCTWTAVSNAGWITITSPSGGNGTGNGNVGFSVAANPGAQRSSTITVQGQVYSITQSPATCTYSIGPTSATIPYGGANNSFTVTTQVGCTWTAVSSAAWITVTSPSGGNGNGTDNVAYHVDANPGAQRSGTITVHGQAYSITQDPAPACSYAVAPASQNFIGLGGTGNISVTTGAGCNWTAAVAAGTDWIAITAGTGSGTGPGTISYTVNENDTGSPRNSSIVVADQLVIITQDAITCNYTLSPVGQSFAYGGGGGSFTVTTTNGCNWTASSTVGWVTVTAGASGTGNGTVTYTVAANPGGARSGTIHGLGVSFSITQDAVPPPPNCQATTFAGSGTAGYGEGTGVGSKWNAPVSAAVAKVPTTGNATALFIADTQDNRIRMVYLDGTSAGQSVLISGNGTAGLANGAASSAMYNHPQGIAVLTDASGVATTLYVADTDNHVIRILTVSGGTWTAATFSGKGGASGLTNGNATNSRYNQPQGITVASSSAIYVADTGNAVLRKLDGSGTSTTQASSGITTPVGVRISGSNSSLLFVSDTGRNSIWQVNTTNGTTTRLAGTDTSGFADGTGTAAKFSSPRHLVWATGDVLYVADRGNNRLRKIVISSGAVTTIAGAGTAGAVDGDCSTATFNLPCGAAYASTGEVYVVDTGNNKIRKVVQP